MVNKALLSTQQVVDGCYMSAKLTIASQTQHGIDLLGPVHPDPSWQVRTEDAFDVACFQVDWPQQTVTYPQGR